MRKAFEFGAALLELAGCRNSRTGRGRAISPAAKSRGLFFCICGTSKLRALSKHRVFPRPARQLPLGRWRQDVSQSLQ